VRKSHKSFREIHIISETCESKSSRDRGTQQPNRCERLEMEDLQVAPGVRQDADDRTGRLDRHKRHPPTALRDTTRSDRQAEDRVQAGRSERNPTGSARRGRHGSHGHQAPCGAADPIIVTLLAGLAVEVVVPWAVIALGRGADAVGAFRKASDLDVGNEDDEQLWLAATLEMDGRHAEAMKTLAAFMTRHPGLRVDGGYLRLLRNRPGTIESAGDCGRPVIASAAKQSPAFRAQARHAGDCFAALAMTGRALSDAVIPGRTLSAPSYADRREEVLKALASAVQAKQSLATEHSDP
jgi:hypothetical protein